MNIIDQLTTIGTIVYVPGAAREGRVVSFNATTDEGAITGLFLTAYSRATHPRCRWPPPKELLSASAAPPMSGADCVGNAS